MAPLKRKRPHDDAPPSQEASAATRRATRQTSTAPLPVPPDPEPRRRRPRADTAEKPGEDGEEIPGAVNGGPRLIQTTHRTMQKAAHHAEPARSTRTTRHGRGGAGILADNEDGVDHTAHRSRGTAPPVEAAVSPRPPPRLGGALHQTRPSQQQMVGPSKPRATSPSIPPQNLQQTHKEAPDPEKPSSRPDRNIDKVVLGNICFRAWYPSYYGKEVLGDMSGNSTKGNGSDPSVSGGSKEDGGAKSFSRRDRDNPPILDRLYVCPCCFKYSKELVTWWEHVRVCEMRGLVPGEKIYVHPRGRRTVLVPSTSASRGPKRRRGDLGTKMIEEVQQDEGEWSIWVVDGEKDVLFCQNLSLFAKLFLDNKSVFFDVTGFNYFLLVYTPPHPEPGTEMRTAEDASPRPQIVGFFSKEKMSWDNNNLACILIFPPWQRKGLGALLMGVSYEISKREGILGGPEKPISDLGKRGYKRFWAGEIARWILSLDAPSGEGEVISDVNDCSKATWIAPEDCLMVLREMGLLEDAGVGPPKEQEVSRSGEEVSDAPEEQKEVPRVRVSRERVRHWITTQGLNLAKSCDSGGFVEGYALNEVTVEEEV